MSHLEDYKSEIKPKDRMMKFNLPVVEELKSEQEQSSTIIMNDFEEGLNFQQVDENDPDHTVNLEIQGDNASVDDIFSSNYNENISDSWDDVD